MKEIRLAAFALASIVPMFAILWWSNSLQYEEQLYQRFRERREITIELREVERLSYVADRLPSLMRLTINMDGNEALPASLANLKQVTYLRLLGNGGANDLSVLQDMPSLKVLKLENFAFNGLNKFLVPLRRLRRLYINHCNLEALPVGLAQLEELEVLSLRHNRLQKGLQFLDWKRLKNLQFLDMSYNLLPSLPAALWQHPSLTYVDLSHNGATAVETVSSTKEVPLQVLRLEHNKLRAWPQLAHCRALRTLSLSHNNLDTLPEQLPWPALEDLRLSSNALERLPEAVGDLQKLRVLAVDDNNLINLPIEATTLPNLVYLDLAGNSLQNLQMANTGWENLRNLYLERNSLKYLPQRLLRLPELHRIAGEGNYLLLEDEWFDLIRPRGWVIQDRDLDLLPSWGTWNY